MKRLLYIAHRLPWPPDKGERVRAFHEIKALSSHFDVTLAALTHGPSDASDLGELGTMCHKVVLAPAGGTLGLLRGAAGSLIAGRSVSEGYFRSKTLIKRIRAEARDAPFDLVFAYCTSVLPYALGVPAAAHVIDLVDVDSAKWASYARASRWPRRWLYQREADTVGRLEQLALQQCQAVFVVSAAEAAALKSDSENIVPVANGVGCDYFAPGRVAPADLGAAALVFTGTMDYRPNAEGVCWFVREVLPALRREMPEVTFAIVGRDPTAAVRKLAEIPGVIVTGSVPDVRPYFEAAAVVVCPLQIARGIQNKVLEAMAMAKPVIASPGAIEGIDAETGRDLLQADSPDQWVRQLGELMSDPARRQTLAAAARRRMADSYSWSARMAPLVSLCDRLAGAPDPHQSAATATGQG